MRARKNNSKKLTVVLLSVILVLCCTIGGTLAWLKDSTETVTNTFTVGNIDIELDESKLNDDGTLNTANRVKENSYKMVPGVVVNKDPKVTVKANSEACWVFIEVTEEIGITGKTVSNYLSYTVDNTVWTKVDGETNVYYATVNATDAKAGKELNIITDKKVTVNSTVTKEMMDAFDVDKNGTLSEEEQKAFPTLKFVAYAIQSDYLTQDGETTVITEAADAWALAKSTT